MMQAMSKRTRFSSRSVARPSAKQVVMSPLKIIGGLFRGFRALVHGIGAPFRAVSRLRSTRRNKKMSKREQLEQLRFSRMVPSLQAEVQRTRRRLFD
ncbi:MAG: hypothetical protein ACI8TP_002854 [Acidimicrobiales bacterium]|jgi:hypothetical protein